ncbi:MAG: hypothetical protein QOJ37_2747 [Pseudonocardiales bacterium]|jgi:hypothetical protein|nr:hypothetical protein [Pseudonocardiales bacterium]
MTDDATQRAAKDAARQDAQWGMADATEKRPVSPERLAYEAWMRGERTFQIDLVVSRDEGFVHPTRGPATRTKQIESDVNIIDRIEEQGWRLEHVALAHAQTGSIGHEGYPWFAFHGKHTALYIFRRVEQAPNIVGPGS